MADAAQGTAEASGAATRFGRWLDRRIPPGPRITLSQRSLFIFPTAAGFAYLGLIGLLMLGAINYRNSMVYAVAFLLGSLFFVAILHSFRNLAGVTLELAGSGSGFVGEEVPFSIRVTRPPGRARDGLQLGWPGVVPRQPDLAAQESAVVKLYVPATERGWLHPGRLIVESRYPLGLLRVWTWLDLQGRALIYPRPLFLDDGPQAGRRRDGGALLDPQGSDDFNGLRRYRPGDSVRHILWRAYARNGELMVKEYAGHLDPRVMLDWDGVAGATEERLSRLTGLALRAARAERAFGLRLPGREIAPAAGAAQLDRVLEALALHGR